MAGNLLLVDDELDILEGLADLYEVELEDVTIYTANNAKKALALLEKIRFDVVVTDINMPKMNGVELFKKIREGWPQCRVIFLTGYREFDHLYEINKHSEVAYVLKSETDDTLIQVVKDAFMSIERMLQEQSKLVQLSDLEETQYRYISSELSHTLSKNRPIDSIFLNEFCQHFNFNREIPCFFFFFKLDPENKKELWEFDSEINSVLTEFVPTGLRFFYQAVDAKQGILVIQPYTNEPDKFHKYYVNAIGALTYLQEKLVNTDNLSLSLITSQKIASIEEIVQIYQEFVVLSYRALKDRSQSIIRKELIEFHLIPNVEIKKVIYQLSRMLEEKNQENFEQEMDKILDIMLLSDSEMECQELYQGVSGVLFTALIKEQALPEAMAIYVPYSTRIEAIKTLIARARLLSSLYEKQPNNYRIDEAVEKVINYITENLAGDLSLNVLAEVCYLNPSYLSRIFRKETGSKISDFVSLKRIDLAKYLLLNSQMKVNEIGQKIGYHTPHSFTRLFKKIEGMSPIEYRDRYGKYV